MVLFSKNKVKNAKTELNFDRMNTPYTDFGSYCWFYGYYGRKCSSDNGDPQSER